jgi:hypothetical protein
MRITRNWQQISASLLVTIGFFVTGWVTGARPVVPPRTVRDGEMFQPNEDYCM